MKDTKTLRTVGGAMLAAAVGLGVGAPAQAALKLVNTASSEDVASITYAKETLLKGSTNVTGAKDKTDSTVYYNILRPHTVKMEDLGMAVQSGDVIKLTYTLEGMVFQGTAPDGTTSEQNFSGTGVNGFVKDTGGASGENNVVYRSTTATLNSESEITLAGFKFAVSEAGGSVTVTAQRQSPGETETKTHGPLSVMVKPALKVTATPALPAPQAKAVGDFMDFGATPGGVQTLRASLGTYEIGVVSPNLEDARGADSSAGDIGGLAGIAAPGRENTTTAAVNGVTFSVEGGFGFVKTLALDNDDTNANATQCATSNDAPYRVAELRKPVTPATSPPTYMNETVAREAYEFQTGVGGVVKQHLCIEVDGKTAIPATEPFMVMAKFKGKATDTAFPPATTTSALAAITHDGTTFNLPLLTTNPGLKQRITIQNRGKAVTWSLINLTTIGDSVMKKAGMGMGALPVGQTRINVWEHIDVTGGTRASGSITIPLPKASVSATMDIIRSGTGAIATTTLMAD